MSCAKLRLSALAFAAALLAAPVQAQTSEAANILSSVLGALTGTGGIQKSSGEYPLTLDRDAYTAGILNGVRGFNAEVAKVVGAVK